MMERATFRKKEDIVIELSTELKRAVSEIRPAMVATANKEGQPNVSPKGSLRVLDDYYLVFADLRSPQTIENLKENPSLSMMGLDLNTRKGWRIWGKADEILTSGDLFDQFTNEYMGKGAINHVVKVIVEKQMIF